MFDCTECRRTYSSQSSLARHKQNHGNSGEFLCSICNVVFCRADLRARHMKLHQGPTSAETASNATPGEVPTLKYRRRCHTACIRCRGLRIKCSSRRPCDACAASGKLCESARDTNRISRAQVLPEADPYQTRDTTFAQLSPLASSPNSHLAPQDASAMASTGLDSALPGGAEVRYENADSGTIDSSHSEQPSFIPQGGDDSRRTEQAPLELGSFSQQTQQLGSPHDMSWPWLYETLFLPNDAVFSSPQVSPPDASDSRGIPHNLSLQGHDESLGYLRQSWQTHSTAAGNLAFGQSYNPPANTPCLPSTSMGFSSGGGRDRDEGDCSIWQYELTQVREATKLAQAQQISALISYASDATPTSQPRSGHDVFWRTMSPKVTAAFGFPNLSSSNVLEEFVLLYLDHFSLLWPLLSRQNLDLDSLHPLLYLVLTSIGAMYGTAAQSTYGRMMHTAIRKPLMLPLEFEDSDDEFLWLAQARLLTQVAALYFGQPKAFSYAQHLGCLLVAQARRLDLFAPIRGSKAVEPDNDLMEPLPPEHRLNLWLRRESRRRLAFGIFRGDTYTSVHLGIKTLVSPEEIDLELPTCDLIWEGKRLEPDVCLLLIDQDRTLGRHWRFSDLYRIAMDQNEPLPALEPTSYELLLFTLQGPLWRFSRDPKMFERLTGRDKDYTMFEGQAVTKSPQSMRQLPYANLETSSRSEIIELYFPPDHLNDSRRQMTDLKREADMLILALQKWKQSLSFVKTLVRSERERGSLLSSLLLYHISYMRLYAPMDDIHQIGFKLAEGHNVDKSVRDRVHQWADTPCAYLAAQHSCHIWELVTNEGQMPEKIRAKFNLLAFTGLHHAATVLWSYAGAAQDARSHDPTPNGNPLLELRSPDPAQPSIRICRLETKALLDSFVRLYAIISPARWSSFAIAASKLSEFQFPLPGD